MIPEDDHLQGEQVKSNNDVYKAYKLKENLSPKNGVISSIANNGYINSNAILKQNGGDSHTWLPLLNHHHHHTNDIDRNNFPTTNNNKWPVLTSPATLSNSKYIWRELPQDDDSMGLFKPNLNTANALGNGNGLNAIRNGHPDKNEHESLTGVVRHPLNGYSNDQYNDRSDCGIGLCRPRWAGMFATTHVFMVIFLLAWILQVLHYFNCYKNFFLFHFYKPIAFSIIIMVMATFYYFTFFSNDPLKCNLFNVLLLFVIFSSNIGNVFYIFC